jgi:hypothetical protein
MDIYALEKVYMDWAAGLEDVAKNEDRRFLKWLTTYMAKNPTAA